MNRWMAEEIRTAYRLANRVRNQCISNQNHRRPPVSLTVEDVLDWLSSKKDVSENRIDILAHNLYCSLVPNKDNSELILKEDEDE